MEWKLKVKKNNEFDFENSPYKWGYIRNGEKETLRDVRNS